MLRLALMITTLLTIPLAFAENNHHSKGLPGNWESISCEYRPPADKPLYLTREISFTETRVEILFLNYFDNACQTPSFTFFFGGDYELTGDSSVADGAKEAILTINRVRITPDSKGMVDFFNSAGPGNCGTQTWEISIEQDITETGCSVIGLPANNITTEYEILYVRDNYLFFAARPLDGTFLDTEDKRPSALLVPLSRVK